MHVKSAIDPSQPAPSSSSRFYLALNPAHLPSSMGVHPVGHFHTDPSAFYDGSRNSTDLPWPPFQSWGQNGERGAVGSLYSTTVPQLLREGNQEATGKAWSCRGDVTGPARRTPADLCQPSVLFISRLHLHSSPPAQ